MSVGQKIKQLRKELGWSQYTLSKESGLPRASLASWERNRTVPKTDVLLKLANIFDVPVEVFYQAAGYVKESRVPYRHKETPEELCRRAMIASPVTLVVCRDFTLHDGEPVEPPESVYIDRARATGKDLYAFRVQGDFLKPQINEGDVLIVDRGSDVEGGDLVACQVRGRIHVGRLKKIEDEIWVEDNHGRFKLEDCEIVAKVIKRETNYS